MNKLKNIITVTPNAFQKMSCIMKKSNNKNGFIFGIDSGGCNGFNFKLQLMEDKELNKIVKQNIVVLNEEVYSISSVLKSSIHICAVAKTCNIGFVS